MYIGHRKEKESLRAVHNAFRVLSSYTIANRVILCSMSDVIANILWIVAAMWDFIQTILRGIQLTCTFTPLVILYPLTKMNRNIRHIWYNMLLIGINFSGPIIIKFGQWASTRRDIFSEELCFYLAKLQRKTTPHSWYYTEKCLENAYGSKWKDIFVGFDNRGQPIGSGCCAQVYKAWIKKENIPKCSSNKEQHMELKNFSFVEVMEMLGLGYFTTYSGKTAFHQGMGNVIPVAVKVQHPQMEKRFRQDLNILKFLANTITWLLPSLRWLSLCECVDDFSQVMKSQVNFFTEAENLKQFADHFKNSSSIQFPTPFDSLTRSYILIETFEEGKHIDDFIALDLNKQTKKDLAVLGVNTVLKMVFEDNFFHGDLHPGNMLVQEKIISNHLWKMPFHPVFKTTMEPTLVILDCGIVASLDERGKKCLKDVFAAVARADGERVAELFLLHSNHECHDIQSFKEAMKEIVEKALSKQVTLHQVDVSVLMNSLFSTMITHKVKVDSSFSSVILAIMVIEGLGRSLDPSIDILERAKPFLFAL
ncbi:hypothetical protein R5R35_000086 [Gryllus longicercus]|uniref:Protein kinase domain-containing protein n=1 Tax=Gryllus longicercus TaxID=2509291 RepID=A0AAN9VIW1_9ORTH